MLAGSRERLCKFHVPIGVPGNGEECLKDEMVHGGMFSKANENNYLLFEVMSLYMLQHILF